MTRYKKELRKRGYKLECDYEYLPFDNYGKWSVAIEAVITSIHNDCIIITECSVVGNMVTKLNSNFEVVDRDLL